MLNDGPKDDTVHTAQWPGGVCPYCLRKFERGNVLIAYGRRWFHAGCLPRWKLYREGPR